MNKIYDKNKMKGYTGKIGRINLTKREVSIESLDEKLLKKFVGGRGLGVKLLYDELKPHIDPLSAENKLIILTGPVTGTAIPTSGRFCVVSKSPLTGTICDSHCGGFFGPTLKGAGFDALILEGKATKPIYILAENGRIELKDASHVWGKDTHETRKILAEKHQGKVLCIGQAGENLVKIASIMSEGDRACGRGGMGAVMGSKNVKAVVAKGDKKIEVADNEKVLALFKLGNKIIDKNPVTGKALKVLGTQVLMDIINAHGILPTYNFQEGVFNDAEGLSGEKMAETITVEKFTCFGCPIGCGRHTKTDKGEGGGPEFETLWAFGAQCGNNDLQSVANINYLCNELGLDTISMGNIVGCAMELSQKGKLKEKISFGDTKMIIKLVRDTAFRKGLGNDLAEGARFLASKYKSPETAMQVKGLEMPAYDPRGVQGHALAYATSNRGCCHLKAYMIGPEVLGQPCKLDRFKTEGKAPIVILIQNISAAVDAMIVCRFSQFALTPDFYADSLSAVTGNHYTAQDLAEVGARIWNLERLFNLREGFSRKDDALPKRFQTPLKEGASRGRIVMLDKMLDEYYKLRGWSKEGVPNKATLKKLGL